MWGVEVPSQTCKYSLKITHQVRHASLMEKAGLSLKTPAAKRVI